VVHSAADSRGARACARVRPVSTRRLAYPRQHSGLCEPTDAWSSSQPAGHSSVHTGPGVARGDVRRHGDEHAAASPRASRRAGRTLVYTPAPFHTRRGSHSLHPVFGTQVSQHWCCYVRMRGFCTWPHASRYAAYACSQVVYVWWCLLWAPTLASWVQVAVEHRLRAVYTSSAWDVLHVVPVVAMRLLVRQRAGATVRTISCRWRRIWRHAEDIDAHRSRLKRVGLQGLYPPRRSVEIAAALCSTAAGYVSVVAAAAASAHVATAALSMMCSCALLIEIAGWSRGSLHHPECS
jgi:hypothetical protein